MKTRPGGSKHNKTDSAPGGLRKFMKGVSTNSTGSPSVAKKTSGGKYGSSGTRG